MRRRDEGLACVLQSAAGMDIVTITGHLLTMKTVGIAQLKARLSAYLRTVRKGHPVVVMDRGTAAIQNLLSTVLFSIAPQLLDIVAAASFVAAALEPRIALIMFFCVTPVRWAIAI